MTEPASEVPSQTVQPAADTPVEELIDIAYFQKIKFRTARIESVEAVPKSKKLYRIQLDLGTLGKRQIVSGIALHYSPESLIGRTIIVVANLKPASLMGVESNGMLLAASTEGDSVLALLTPDKEIQPGSAVR